MRGAQCAGNAIYHAAYNEVEAGRTVADAFRRAEESPGSAEQDAG